VLLEQHDARPQPLDELEAVLGARRRADRHEPRLGAQQHREPGPDRGLGIDDGDPGHGQHPPSRG
jgi:hypothetical protein